MHLYVLAVPHFETLWHDSAHDRNGHYSLSQSFALAMRSGDAAGFVKELHAATVWPPGHSLAAGLVMAVTGMTVSAAVAASLTGLAATAFFAFLLARRLAPHGGDGARWVAALFVLASPAHRAFATERASQLPLVVANAGDVNGVGGILVDSRDTFTSHWRRVSRSGRER